MTDLTEMTRQLAQWQNQVSVLLLALDARAEQLLEGPPHRHDDLAQFLVLFRNTVKPYLPKPKEQS